ncbi:MULTISPECIES: SapC family protein [Pseudoalteromonas]|uniref:SapC family protein n=1 Tax=Pseudoalteromonas TaxID=53246 RepID=UPI00029AD374|nr:MULTISPECIES: SapC family protein [Pseudoalteromonas]MBR8842822.1 SapC family protein [Pseudoalteromonas sp. JC3]NSY36260.1 SapC protein [Pseudoalteromonas sp. JC28]PAX99216.1 SapC protein [Pseudoalteromonas sp. HM-SA03]QUI70594.1 SapC protein [Pseudoalteromonas sp. M8]UDM62033.1 SapC family protein [Pseudoalteromonas piscicida]
MSEKYEIIDAGKHKKFYAKLDTDLLHSKERHLVVITPSEVAKAALNFPICFIKSGGDAKFQMIAILGLETGKNAFYRGNRFESPYIPQHLVKYPFVLAKTSDEKTYLAIHASALNSSGIGEPLFQDSGELSDFLKLRHSQLEELYRQDELSFQFVNRLSELGLLTEFSFKFDLGDGEKKEIGGLYSVDRELLNSLDDESLLSLQKSGMLEAVHAHLLSLGQLQRVIDLSATANH